MPPPTDPATNWQSPQHAFPLDFQWQVVKLMVSDPRFFMQVKPHLPLEFFAREDAGGEYLVKAVSLIYGHAETPEHRSSPPSRMVFATLAAQHVQRLEGTQRQLIEQGLTATLQYLYDQPWQGTDLQFVRDHTFRWVRDRASRSLTVEIKKGIDAGRDIEELRVVERAKQIAMIGASTSEKGIQLFQDTTATWQWLQTKEFRATMSTGAPMFDKTMGGGYGRKELTTFIAAPNVGKTSVMCDQTGKLIANCRRGIYISLEQSDLLIMQKILASLLNLPTTEWFSSEQNINALWQWVQYLNSSHAFLALRQLPANKASVADIEAYILNTAQDWGVMPDFVTVDYADLAAPANRYNDKRHQLAEVYTDLRSLATEHNIAIITASQANRNAVGAERVGIEDLAEAFDKAAISDVMIAIAQTDEEQAQDRARLFWAKNRIDRKYVEIPVTINYALARMQEQESRMGVGGMEMQAKDVMNRLQNIMGNAGG